MARREWGPIFEGVYNAVLRYNGPQEEKHLARLVRQAWVEGKRRVESLRHGGRRWGVNRGCDPRDMG